MALTFEQIHSALMVEVKEIANIQERYQEGLFTSAECMFRTLECTQNATRYLSGILNLTKAEVAKEV